MGLILSASCLTQEREVLVYTTLTPRWNALSAGRRGTSLLSEYDHEGGALMPTMSLFHAGLFDLVWHPP